MQGSIAEEFRRELSGLVEKAGVWHVRDRYRWPSLSGFTLSHVKIVDITMNGFSDHALDEGAFGESKATSVVKAFDAFRMFHHLPPSIISSSTTLTATLHSQNETVVPDQDTKWRSMDALPRLRLVPAGSDRGAPLVRG